MSIIKRPPYTPKTIASIFDATLKGLPVNIKCIWVKAYIEPDYDKGLCIRSYDKTILNGSSQIGTATGNYFIDSKNVVWVETSLLKCDRAGIGWVRQSDVIINKPETPDNTTTKKSSWLAWLTGGIALLSALS